jgi:predicted neutral ceramidase superfamily lipid hydrolase
MSKLTNKQQDFFTYTGTFGALLATTCLVQHMAITRDHWITYVMMLIYIFSILGFVLLALKKVSAPILLIVSAVLVLIAELILIRNFVFSLVVLLLFLYSTVIVVSLYVEQLPKKLKEQALAEKIENEMWKDKI